MAQNRKIGQVKDSLRPLISGFTLIELMITIAVLALLLAIAIPSYTNYVLRTNRAEAQVELLNAASALERCYSRFSAYDSDNCAIKNVLSGDGISSESETYVVTETRLTATEFTLQAAPQGSQTRDTECGSFSLTHTGQRGISNTDTPIDKCWRR